MCYNTGPCAVLWWKTPELSLGVLWCFLGVADAFSPIALTGDVYKQLLPFTQFARGGFFN